MYFSQKNTYENQEKGERNQNDNSKNVKEIRFYLSPVLLQDNFSLLYAPDFFSSCRIAAALPEPAGDQDKGRLWYSGVGPGGKLYYTVLYVQEVLSKLTE